MRDDCILVTGASSGIGRETAVSLSKGGSKLVLVSRNEKDLMDTLSLMSNRDAHLVVPYDLCDFDNYGNLFDQIKDSGFILKGMVHCAGISRIIPLRAINKNNSMDIFDIHYFAFLELVKWYAKRGISEGGSIVGVSSINVHTPQKCMTAYASAKAAMESACRTLALELAEKNIRINSVVVGGISTKMSENVSTVLTGVKSDYVNPVARQLLGIGTPEQIVGVIKFLLSEESSFITGREIYADGGLL